MFFNILHKTTVMYRPLSQANFLEILNMIFEKIDTGKKEILLEVSA